MTEQKLVKIHGLTVKVREKCLEALDCTAADIFVKEKSELQKAKEILQSAKRILVLTGAGVSAESNVPTFRGGGGASVWRGIQFEQLSSAQMVEENLPLVWEWFDYRRGVVAECEPNAAHRTIADWQRAGDFDEFTLVTQNIDGLHRRAGSSKVLELHGNIWRARCQMCGETFDVRDIPSDERPPVCKLCGDFLRPNVVLFGENLPARILESAMERAANCDVCLVVGTSSLVYPAASLPEIARRAGAKIIEVNPEPTALTEQADVSIRGKAGEILPLLSASVIGNLNNSEEYVSQSEAAKLRGVSRQRIGQLVKSGCLKTVGEGHDALISVENLINLTEGKKGRPRKIVASEDTTETTNQTSTIADRMRDGMDDDPVVTRPKSQSSDKQENDDDSENDLNVRGDEGFFLDGEDEAILDKVWAEIAEEDEENELNSSEIISGKHFLLYWREENVVAHAESDFPLDVIGSNQLGRASTGDTIWLVTINSGGELVLAGRMRVDKITDYKEAARIVGDSQLWEAAFYALPKRETIENLDYIALGAAAYELRFNSLNADRFDAARGKINPQQMQAMRELTAESAQMLTGIWENDDEDFDDDNYTFPDEEDIRIFEDIVRREPLDASSHYNLGVVYGQTGNIQAAREAYRRAVEILPEYFEAWYNLGADYIELGDPREAVKCFDKAIEAKPDFAVAHFMKGAAFDRLNNHEQAIRSTLKGLEFAPDDAQAFYNLGNSYLRMGDAAQAVNYFERAAEIAPDFADAFFEAGRCREQLGENAVALEAYRRAAQVRPDFVEALLALGSLYHLEKYGTRGELDKDFSVENGFDLQDPRSFLYLGTAFLATGEPGLAREQAIALREMRSPLADLLDEMCRDYRTPDGE